MGLARHLPSEVAELARSIPTRIEFRREVMDLLDRHMGYVDGMLHFLDPHEPADRGVIRSAAPWHYIEDGLSNWHTLYSLELQPVWLAADATRGVAVDTEVLGRDARSRLRFYNHVMAGIRAHHTMWSHLRVHGEIVATLAMTRRGRGFSDGEQRLVQEIRPVLAIAEACYRAAPASPAASEIQASLTPRELEVVNLVVRGLTNPEIAVALALSLHTVRNHLNTIFRKLDVGTRAELAGMVARHVM